MKKFTFLMLALSIATFTHAQGILGKIKQAVTGDSSKNVLSGIK
jgi:hypothetical protein